VSTQDRLQRLTAQARKQAVQGREEREAHRGAPRVGDVFRHDETAALAVLWTLVEHDVEAGRFLAIAADFSPLVSSTDVAAPPGDEGEALSLRCGVEVGLDEGDLSDATWAGSLKDGVLAEVRRKRTEIVAGGAEGGLFARETDVDAEYRDWMEDGPEKAQALMLRRRSGKVLAFRSPRQERFFGIPASLAASVLLMVSLGLLAGLFWQQDEGERSFDEQVNLPFVQLGAGRVRDGAATLGVASASSFVLLFETDAAFETYRLEIRGQDDGALVWTSDELIPMTERTSRVEPIVLSVLLPCRLFEDGEYRVRLEGVRGDRAEKIEEALLRLQLD
jgi:hypothetical protein